MVPETRYKRSYDTGIADEGNDSAASIQKDSTLPTPKRANVVELENNSNNLPQDRVAYPKKKSYIKQLSLYSGVPKDVNYFSIWVRPFPMIAYPAVIFGLLTCKS